MSVDNKERYTDRKNWRKINNGEIKSMKKKSTIVAKTLPTSRCHQIEKACIYIKKLFC